MNYNFRGITNDCEQVGQKKCDFNKLKDCLLFKYILMIQSRDENAVKV